MTAYMKNPTNKAHTIFGLRSMRSVSNALPMCLAIAILMRKENRQVIHSITYGRKRKNVE